MSFYTESEVARLRRSKLLTVKVIYMANKKYLNSSQGQRSRSNVSGCMWWCLSSFCSRNKPPSSASLCLLPRPPRGSAFNVDVDWSRWADYDESYYVYQQRNGLVAADDARGDTALVSGSVSTPQTSNSDAAGDEQCDR